MRRCIFFLRWYEAQDAQGRDAAKQGCEQIHRVGYRVRPPRIRDGACEFCLEKVAGVWE